MNQYDVMYVDDERNADHRARPPMGRSPVPGRRTVVVPPNRNPTVIYSAPGAGQTFASSPQVMYQPSPFGQPSLASRFGMTMGELLDTGLQIFAAINGLPAAPVSQGETGVDTENLVIYQTALANHAKRDEQLRTLGSLLVRILK
jgi:hypothetical protein